jgi:hypothetical protein
MSAQPTAREQLTPCELVVRATTVIVIRSTTITLLITDERIRDAVFMSVVHEYTVRAARDLCALKPDIRPLRRREITRSTTAISVG